MNDNYGYELIRVSNIERVYVDLVPSQMTNAADDRIMVGYKCFDTNGNEIINKFPVLNIESDLWLFRENQ